MKKLQAFRGCTRAATAVEYGLILALIFMAMIGALGQTADGTNKMWNNVSSTVGTVM
ncbi:MAG: Flp family type IVb pilin [Sphingopyxis sp.]|nr:Flp family type IVb pilin [Sphingopyxis sp.]